MCRLDVSIVIPAYNAEAFLPMALTSALLQEGVSFEILVVDDGSKDRTADIVRESSSRNPDSVFLLQHLNGENRGVSQSRLLGISQARGEYVAFLDADDCFLPGKLRQQVNFLNSNPDVILSHTSARLLNDDVGKFRQISANKIGFNPFGESGVYNLLEQDYRLKRCPICNSSVLVRRKPLQHAFKAIPQAYQCEDWLTWCLLAQRGNFYYLDEPLVEYRIHANSFTEQNSRDQLKQTFGTIEFYASLSVLAEDAKLRQEAEQRLLEKVNLLRRIYAQGDVARAFFDGDDLALNDWHARLIWERDAFADRVHRLNANIWVRLLRRLGLIPKS